MHLLKRSRGNITTLARDVVGIDDRQQRARNFFQRCRGFHVQPPSHQTITAPAATTDDEFIPLTTSVNGASPSDEQSRPQLSSQHGSNEEWHAGVEILSHRSGTAAQVPSHSQSLSKQVLELPSISRHMLQKMQTSDPNTTSVSRIQRKEMRLREGTYKPRAPKVTATGAGKESATKQTSGKIKVESTTKGQEIQSRPKKEPWQIQKAALQRKFGETGWQPRKRLSPDALEGLRALHASDPTTYSTGTLAEHFSITSEAVRRILKSKWKPSPEEIEARMKRWEKRGLKKWGEMAAQGVKPPKKWRDMGVENPVLKKKLEAGGEHSKTNRSEGKHDRQRKMKWDHVVADAKRLPRDDFLADRIV